MPDQTAEALRADLMATAQRRFGPERAAALAPEIAALAADLARVAEAPLPTDQEPAFFLFPPGPPSPAGYEPSA